MSRKINETSYVYKFKVITVFVVVNLIPPTIDNKLFPYLQKNTEK